MNLTLLETFLAVARTESFTKTASLVGRSQSAVSRQIQDLETTLGVRLFDRLSGKVSLTAAGRMLLQEAPQVLQQMKNIQERLRDFGKQVMGDLRIGATVSAASTFLPRVLAKFRRSNPSVKLSLLPGHSDVLVEKLRTNELDVAVLGKDVDQRDVKTCYSIPDQIVLVAAPDHPLAGRKSTFPEELNAVEFMFREPGSDSRSVVKEWLRKHQIEVPTLLELW
jgi:LysR family transcriptional regulator, low CO2-responsive transcriptional regulator